MGVSELLEFLKSNWSTIVTGSFIAGIVVAVGLAILFSVGIAVISLVVASFAVFLTLLVSILDATTLERKRQQTKLAVEREILRNALFNEMADIIRVFHQIVFSDSFLSRLRGMEPTRPSQLSFFKEIRKKVDRFMSFSVYDSANRDPVLFFGLEGEARNISRFYKMIWNGISELDSAINRAEQHPLQLEQARSIIQDFEEKFLKTALLYLDERSLDYLGQFFDPDDAVYFARLRGSEAATTTEIGEETL